MKFANIFILLILLTCLNYGFAAFLTIRVEKEVNKFDEIGINVYRLNDNGGEDL
jgi:hypothetical protein